MTLRLLDGTLRPATWQRQRRVENASEGVTIQITKTAEAAGVLNIYLYVLMDAQLNIEDGRFVSALY